MAWIRHRLRDADVWAKVDTNGALVTDRDGRVEIVYKPVAGAKIYRAGARNLTAVSGERPLELDLDAGISPEAEAIHVWTDGACTGNPGPAGLGVVVVDRGAERELSEYLGMGTNNIAELTAILRGLQSIPTHERVRPVIVYSDSTYAIGLLTQSWKAKANQELVATLRALAREFASLRFVKVPAHSGVPLNERVDELARQAIVRSV